MSTTDSTFGSYESDIPTTKRTVDATPEDVKTRPIELADTTRANVAETGYGDEPEYIRQDAQDDVNARWKEVQGEFVDDPRKSVAHAHQLVSDAVQRIVDTFTEERNQLERQWSEGQDVSTEDLRVCLKRYRAFFSRLIPIENAKA
jgi:hypothetical protein